MKGSSFSSSLNGSNYCRFLVSVSPGDTVDTLRQRLRDMKKVIADKQGAGEEQRRKIAQGSIDGNFLGWVFGFALFVILSVSAYAFYNLYLAILKKFPAKHTEL